MLSKLFNAVGVKKHTYTDRYVPHYFVCSFSKRIQSNWWQSCHYFFRFESKKIILIFRRNFRQAHHSSRIQLFKLKTKLFSMWRNLNLVDRNKNHWNMTLPNQELSVLYGGPTLNYGGKLSLYVSYMLRVNMTWDLAYLQFSDLQGETRPICRT